MSPTPMITIRDAQLDDLESIRNLVVELAIFEKAPDAVTATLEDYQRLFMDGLFQCLVAEENARMVGIALYYDTFSTWKGRMMYLEDLVVTEKYRSKGVGGQLLDAFLAKSKEKGAVLAKWQVLDWNENAIRFYEKRGAEVEKGWWNVKFWLK